MREYENVSYTGELLADAQKNNNIFLPATITTNDAQEHIPYSHSSGWYIAAYCRMYATGTSGQPGQ
jgi:hypothetical protein